MLYSPSDIVEAGRRGTKVNYDGIECDGALNNGRFKRRQTGRNGYVF